ncbi:MAG: YceI family protein [Terricaulis sp.]
MRRLLILAAATAALFACGAPQAPTATDQTSAPATTAEQPVQNTAPAGDYTLEKAHASLIVRMSHMGYSNFTARFTTWATQLHFDPAAPEDSTISVTIDPRSITSDNPPPGFIDIMRNQFLEAPKFSSISFRSTSVARTGPNTARITGDLTLHGVTKPVTLDAHFNGGYPGMSLDPHARIGFSAQGTFKRSDFGISYGLPPPGTTMGVGDDVEVIVECEMSGPAWTPGPGDTTAPTPQH